MPEEGERYTPDEAQEEATRMQEKIKSGEAQDYDEAERMVGSKEEGEKTKHLPNELTQEEQDRTVELGAEIFGSVKKIIDGLPAGETLKGITLHYANQEFNLEAEFHKAETPRDSYIDLFVPARSLRQVAEGLSEEEEDLSEQLNSVNLMVGETAETFYDIYNRIGYDERFGRLTNILHLDEGVKGARDIPSGVRIPPSDKRYRKYAEKIASSGGFRRVREDMLRQLKFIAEVLRSEDLNITVSRPLKK